MSTNTYKQKEMNAVEKLLKQIKKEHFIKTALWVVGIILTLLWLAFTIGCSISMGDRYVNDKKVADQLTWAQLEEYWIKGKHHWKESETSPKHYVVYQYTHIVDWNPLCLTYDKTLTGYYLCILLAPIGYLGIIFIIAYLKNMITPGAIKKTVRKALQFNYLKQKDVDYVVDEIDYNIGIKIRPEDVKNEETRESHFEELFEQK